ncbi:MAG: CpsB/CapC family capsule biosynthesis tyrosine phosphatase [Bryobacteraceae bacterium]|nr:CpsB/CapC family capsule biosynthesis tyrosine phosphatase [Bryobacteraceae bacterium]
MIDIHSHILPGVDDGAATLDESLEMLRLAAEDGTTDIVATPHASFEFPYNAEKVREALARVQEAAGDRIRVHLGCDLHLSYENIQNVLKAPATYTVNGGRYLLVEFPDMLIAPTTEVIFEEMKGVGVTPLVTHPERNPLLQQRLERMAQWVAAGVLLQVTGDSFLGRWGREARGVSEELMNRNLVHFVASDAHGTRDRTPRLGEAFAYVKDKWGEARAERLFRVNPGAVIRNEELPAVAEEPAPVQRPWYRIW